MFKNTWLHQTMDRINGTIGTGGEHNRMVASGSPNVEWNGRQVEQQNAAGHPPRWGGGMSESRMNGVAK